ncbi:hypothetical protein ACLVNK_04335 [Streptococcus pneumoniae]|uniref:hypothetical protein n=1 Tax=Streptococcus pneumoniae TaxID=1313 RepID=UPI000988171A|nr:hypothetical protein IPP24_00019 [Streptococcus phage IPP24]VOT73502.1 Uncharacterised protein [Streptococcus pneumoniae]VPV05550.1 Uncharacterised protein [Streptococcus pneumoniae]
MIDLDKKMIGSEFGWLTVIEFFDSKNGRKRYKCQCRCGKKVIKVGKYLRQGKTTSCGCVRFKKFKGINSRTYKDLTGQTFGKLTVIRINDFEGSRARFLCRCECGNTTVVRSSNLQNGGTKSCGCLVKSIEGSVAPLLEHLKRSLSVEQGTSVYSLIEKSAAKSGHKGVYFDSGRGKWKAMLTFKRKTYQKRFDTKEEAIRYREELEEEFFRPVIERAYQMGVLNEINT